MGALHGLFELHLVAEENKVLRTSSHSNSVGQRHLPGFIDEKEVEGTFPLGPGKEPSRSADNAMRLAPIIDGGAAVKAFVISVSHKPARFNAHVLFDERWLHSPPISSLKSPSAAKPSGGCLPVCICIAIIIGIACFILHSK
jgi:hypothetical protein